MECRGRSKLPRACGGRGWPGSSPLARSEQGVHEIDARLVQALGGLSAISQHAFHTMRKTLPAGRTGGNRFAQFVLDDRGSARGQEASQQAAILFQQREQEVFCLDGRRPALGGFVMCLENELASSLGIAFRRRRASLSRGHNSRGEKQAK
jgi:hypothetical protein